MKRVSFVTVCNLLMLYFLFSCSHLNNHDIQITISESEQYYKMFAHYNKDQTNAVDKYIDDHLSKGNNISFINTRIDADITLDDRTKFYMNKSPGYLEIKFNKNDNTLTSYKKIKALGEGLKQVMK